MKHCRIRHRCKAAEARLRNMAGVAEQIGAIRSVQVGASASASETKVSYAYQAYMPPHNWNDYGSVTANFSYDFDFWGKTKRQSRLQRQTLQPQRLRQRPPD